MEYHRNDPFQIIVKKTGFEMKRIGFNYSITSGYDVVVGTHYICFSTTSIVDLLEKTGRKKKNIFVCVYLLQVGQSLAMRCRCRTPDFDITGRIVRPDTLWWQFCSRFWNSFFHSFIIHIYSIYIYADRYEGRNTAIFYLSLLSFSFALSLFLSLSLFLFLSSLKFLFIIMHRMWRRVISLGWSRGENESIRINIRAFVWIIYLCIFYKRILWIIFIIWKYESFRL